MFSAPEPYMGQEYEKLRKEAQAAGKLFEDPLFKAEQGSLFSASGSGAGKISGIQWKRPKVSVPIF